MRGCNFFDVLAPDIAEATSSHPRLFLILERRGCGDTRRDYARGRRHSARRAVSARVTLFLKEMYALPAILGALIQVSFGSLGMEAD
jgi:hypothetical protein